MARFERRKNLPSRVLGFGGFRPRLRRRSLGTPLTHEGVAFRPLFLDGVSAEAWSARRPMGKPRRAAKVPATTSLSIPMANHKSRTDAKSDRKSRISWQ